MPRWNAPKPTHAVILVILVAAGGAALTWIAHAPERGAALPQLPAPPAPPAIHTPNLGLPPVELAIADSPPPGGDTAAGADTDLAGAEPAESAPPALPSPWRALDANAYTLTPATVTLHARLPGTYQWPLPAIDRLELICFHPPDGPAHLAVMRAADGRLYHWGEERRFLQEHLEAGGIDSREIRTVAGPGAFMQPLRAAAHAACERSLQAPDPPFGPK